MPARTTSIAALINQIRNDEIALPDLQRDFVWTQDQIRLLLDSIMHDYPFGSLLLWNTQHVEVPFRDFVKDYHSGQTFIPKQKATGRAMKMVLDGQQRLQSLYIAMHGTYDGKHLYFNVTSGPEGSAGDDDDGPRSYRFEFWREDEPNRPKRLLRVAEIIGWAERQAEREAERAIADAGLSGDEARLGARNIRLLRGIVKTDIVPIVIIDEEVLEADQARSVEEILDIFVRVNSGGTRLTRSDLMFSLIKTKWGSAREKFDRLIAKVNSHGIAIDKDFVIRGLLTVADAPPSYDVDNVTRNFNKMVDVFDTFEQSLTNALDFCRAADGGALASASQITPVATLFPIVYYLSRRKSCAVPDSERTALRAMLHFLLFNDFLGGKSPEARIRYLREVLQRTSGESVPLASVLSVIEARQRQHSTKTSDAMLNRNPRLALTIVQPRVNPSTLSWQEQPEVDHIFPQSTFRPTHGALVDDIGNFAFLGKLRNIRKSDTPPWEYFKDTPDDVLRDSFLVGDRSLLAADRFEEFITTRRAAILEKVKNFLGQ